MSHHYKNVTSGKLKLKGKNIFKADRPAKKKTAVSTSKTDPDADEHGGWWRITEDADFRGGIEIAIEAGDFSRAYLAAMDNGTFTLGSNHFNEPEPYPEEILSLIKTPDDSKFSLKTGFNRYCGVDLNGQLIATSEAIGPRERFEVIFQDDKCAIQAVSSNLFLTWLPDDDGKIYVSSKTAGEKQYLNIRTAAKRYVAPNWSADQQMIDSKESGECETSYVKMYQHSKVDLKNRMINYDVKDTSSVRRAQNDGNLHETLLNRRQKLKSDKYC
ncbi:FRG1 domain containing protein [Aphelenchoides besseyi]|nr:FRG1 domain containing protein [Aphelenchoides besseyi]